MAKTLILYYCYIQSKIVVIMSYLSLNSDILSKKTELMNKEVLMTNPLGCYYNTTLYQCNTRKYHGALVAPQKQISPDNQVILSCMSEIVVYKDEQYGLNSMLFTNAVELPEHRAAIVSADVSPTLQYTYTCGEMKIRKSVLLMQNAVQLIYCYQVLETPLPIVLRLNPFFAFRGVHALNHSEAGLPMVRNTSNGIKVIKGFPSDVVFLQSSQPPMFTYMPDCWHNVYYPCEESRGYEATEDLFTPGTMEYALHSGDILYLSVSLSEMEPYSIRSRFNKELAHRRDVTSYASCLQKAAKQFIITEKDKHTYIKAGFPWFGTWGRDTFISLPGISLAQIDIIPRVIDTMKHSLNQGLFPNISVEGRNSYNSVDTSLWFFWTLQQYADSTRYYKRVWHKYGSICKDILNNYRNGTFYSIRMDDNGLLWQGEEGKALTWMDAIVDGKPVTQRKGYAVEVNALWYNAITFCIEMATYAGDEKFVKGWIDIAEDIPLHFQSTFWNDDYGYLADCVLPDYSDFSIRPNMIFAVSLPYSPIDEHMRKAVVDKVKDELLTSRGLRTLSPTDTNYHPHCQGSQAQRDLAYHQGTVWPWLLGPFVEAYLKVYGFEGISFARSIYADMESALKENCIGTVAEIYDGDEPHTPRGAVAQAWSVAELLRIKNMIDKLY